MNCGKRQDKKNHILKTGMEVMYQHGYNGTGVKDIVDAAGIPKGSFYNYFESKEEFVMVALEQMFGCVTQNCCFTDDKTPPLERLTQFFEKNAESAKQGGYLFGCFLGNISQEMSDVNEPVRQKTDLLLSRFTNLIEDVLREAQVKGDIPEQRDVKLLAQFIFNAWEGTLMRMKAAKNHNAFDAFLEELPRLLKSC